MGSGFKWQKDFRIAMKLWRMNCVMNDQDTTNLVLYQNEISHQPALRLMLVVIGYEMTLDQQTRLFMKLWWMM